jgi:glycosyltransferase involved in cell wall biosynthesis
MFGRMEAYKGLGVLLGAMRLLQGTGSKIELRIAGAGPDLDALRQDFEALPFCSIESRFVPREMAIAEFGDAALVVAPYTEASQSGVISAAFANGRPVIASAVGGIPDFVIHGRNGLLVPPNDPRALVDALRTAIGDRSLVDSLSDGAQLTAETDISWSKFADGAIRCIDAIREGDR